jgi:predicted nuclease with TOPRIM domain
MKKVFITVGIFLAFALGVLGCGDTANSRIQELEDENSQLRGKLDNIQDLVAQAKSDLDDVQTEAQSDETCDDTNAYSYATNVEDKLNEIDSETLH